MSTGEIEAIWAAVDRLTKPVKLLIQLDDGTTTDGLVPCLWDLTAEAVTRTEPGETALGRLRERTPLDLDLMEMRLTIIEFTRHELHRFAADYDADMPAQLRRLASTAIAREPGELDFWAYRFRQWADMLANYLEPVNRGRRLRARCPRCKVERVEVDTTAGPVMAHPIYVHFGSDGFIRAAVCGACEFAWWRGEQLLALAEEIGATPPSGVVLADVG